MDDSNHEMVNMLNTNQSYQLLATQMGRIADFFGVPQVHNQQIPQVQNVVPLQIAQKHQIMPLCLPKLMWQIQ
jgi:hypothetical protein